MAGLLRALVRWLNDGRQAGQLHGHEARDSRVNRFKHRNEIGLDVALEALKDARARTKVSIDDIWRFAKVCRVANVMRAYLESIG